jgi:hypothetical protein
MISDFELKTTVSPEVAEAVYQAMHKEVLNFGWDITTERPYIEVQDRMMVRTIPCDKFIILTIRFKCEREHLLHNIRVLTAAGFFGHEESQSCEAP